MNYPLEQVLDVKNKRVEEAERVLVQKKELLKQEEKKLEKQKQQRDKVSLHYEEKLDQFRELLDTGESHAPELLRMKDYIKLTKEKLKIEEEKVKKQKDEVELAEKNVKVAEQNLKQKRLDVDKIMAHKKEWIKEDRREKELQEAKEQDELGSIMFLSKRMK